MEFTIENPKQFRYELINNNAKNTKVLYVLHGYGQLVKFFIRKFQFISDDILIVAPEGMHRFYLQGTHGRVGASWMTKEARSMDIQDNISWLDALDKKISEEFNISERSVLGFSQGGSTAIRWNIHGDAKINNLIVWGTDFPPDEEPFESQLQSNDSCYYILGTKDEFIDEVKGDELCSKFESLNFSIVRYDGKHDLHESTLEKVLREIHDK